MKPIIGNHVAAHDRFPHVPTQAAHLGYGGLGVLVDGPGDDGVLQGPHDLVEEREIFRLQGIDDHLATGVDSQVAFRLKANERISQRRVADAEFVADGRKLPSRICCRMYSYTIILPETAAVSFPARDGAALDF